MMMMVLLLAGMFTYHTGVVYKVHDGDSVKVMVPEQMTLRLACVDAPEIGQKHALASRDYLRGVIMGKTIDVSILSKDRYGRNIALIFYQGRNLNVEMVAQGHAFVDKRYVFQCDPATMYEAEEKARSKRLGVWGAGTMKPWEYRSQKRNRRRD